MIDSHSKVHPVCLGAIATFVVLAFNSLPILAIWKLVDSGAIAFQLASLAYQGVQIAIISWIAFRAGGTGWSTWLLPFILLAVGLIRTAVVAEWASSRRFSFDVNVQLWSHISYYGVCYGFFVAAAMVLRLVLAGDALPNRFPTATLKRIGCLMGLFAVILAIEKLARSIFTTFYTPFSLDILVSVLFFGRTFAGWDADLAVTAACVGAAYPIKQWKWFILVRVLVLVFGSLLIVALSEFHVVLFLLNAGERPNWWDNGFDAIDAMRITDGLVRAGVTLSSFYISLLVIHLAGYRWHVKPSKSEKIMNDKRFSLDLVNSEAKTLNDEKLY